MFARIRTSPPPSRASSQRLPWAESPAREVLESPRVSSPVRRTRSACLQRLGPESVSRCAEGGSCRRAGEGPPRPRGVRRPTPRVRGSTTGRPAHWRRGSADVTKWRSIRPPRPMRDAEGAPAAPFLSRRERRIPSFRRIGFSHSAVRSSLHGRIELRGWHNSSAAATGAPAVRTVFRCHRSAPDLCPWPSLGHRHRRTRSSPRRC